MVSDVSRTATLVRVCSKAQHFSYICILFFLLFLQHKRYSRGWKNKATLLGFGCEHKLSPLIHDQRELTRWSFDSLVIVACICVVSFQTDWETILEEKKIICLQCTKPALMWSLFITKIRKDQDAVTFHMLYKSCIKRKAELLVWTYILQPLNTYGYDFASYLFIITVLRYVKRSFFYLHQMKKLSLYVLNHRKKSIHSK